MKRPNLPWAHPTDRKPTTRTAAPIVALSLVLAACAGRSEVESLVAEVEQDLPEDWHADVVEDDDVGEFVFSSAAGTVTWTVGSDLDALETATDGTAWAEFWLPQLRSLSSDQPNVRAVTVDTTTLRGEVVSWKVNVAPLDPQLPNDNPAALAVAWTNRFLAQGLDVRKTAVTAWRDENIATVGFEVPPEVFGGEPRYVRQWFVAQPGSDRLWSFVCDGPVDPVASQSLCETALHGFRPTPAGSTPST